MIPTHHEIIWKRREQKKQRVRIGHRLPSLLPLFSPVLFLCLFLIPNPLTAGEFKLSDGDRVVFVGSTLIEREQESGYWETALTCRFPKSNVTFRNLGWSGDTVFCDARAMFEPPAVGFQHLKEDLSRIKPTVIFVGYGMNESFEGEAGLPKFQKGLASLLDMLGSTKARILILSPPPQEETGRLPDPAKHNHDLELYRATLRKEAEKRGLVFVDFFSNFQPDPWTAGSILHTDNSIHFTDFGYWRSGQFLKRTIGAMVRPWRIEIDKDGKINVADSVQISDVRSGPLRFQSRDQELPTSPPQEPPDRKNLEIIRIIRVPGLPLGKYSLRIDGREVALADADNWVAGIRLTRGPEFDQVEKLRQTIIEKNRLFFHRWRPQNETYLYGFRKHEQGQNGREIPEFDPLIAQLEKKIAQLRVPVPHQYELVPIKD
jgi:hypothetical protein